MSLGWKGNRGGEARITLTEASQNSASDPYLYEAHKYCTVVKKEANRNKSSPHGGMAALPGHTVLCVSYFVVQ